MLVKNILPGFKQKEIVLGASKSHLNRALIIGALKNEVFKVEGVSSSTDVDSMVECLKEIGLDISDLEDGFLIKNSFPQCEESYLSPLVLNVGDGGTTTRFLLALLSLGKREYHLRLSGEMSKRPMTPLIDTLRSLGASCSLQEDTITIKGPIRKEGEVSIDCSQTTQFASALVLLNTVCKFDLKFENLSASKRYLELSKKLVSTSEKQNELSCPGDFSSLGYVGAYAFFNNNIVISNISEIDELQTDSKFLEIYKELGGHWEFIDSKLYFYKCNEPKSGVHINGEECIDLVPTLIFMACFLNHQSSFTNLRLLKFKESDRLSEVIKLLKLFGVKFDYNEEKDTLIVHGHAGEPLQESIQTAFDHRMVMIGALFLKMNKGGDITPAESVNKSFKSFFDIF